MTLDKWPMDPSAPDTQNAIAEVYDLLVTSTKVGRRAAATTRRKVLEARTALAKYIGDTPWVDANKDNPAALQRAEELVRTRSEGRGGHAHAQRAGGARAGEQTSDPKEQLRLTNYALSGVQARRARLARLPEAGRERARRLQEPLLLRRRAAQRRCASRSCSHGFDARQYPEPSSQEIATARDQAAVAVRDSDEDDEYIDNAGLFVVDLAYVERDLAYQRWKDSSGTQGIEQLKDLPKLEGTGRRQEGRRRPTSPTSSSSTM